MVQRMSDELFSAFTDDLHFWREMKEWEGLVAWMAVDGHGAIIAKFTLAAYEARDFTALMVHLLPANFVVELCEDDISQWCGWFGGMREIGGEEVVKNACVAFSNIVSWS